jgi:hypothetical protein
VEHCAGTDQGDQVWALMFVICLCCSMFHAVRSQV